MAYEKFDVETEDINILKAYLKRIGDYSRFAEGPSGLKTHYMLITPSEWSQGSSTDKPSDANLPLVVFFHGITTPCATSFLRLAIPLLEAGTHRVLLYDLYGRGLSDTPDPIESFQYNEDLFLKQAEDLLEALEENETKFTLIGLSMGGALASHFTAKHPKKVEKLVLVAPAGLPMEFPLVARIATMDYIGDALAWFFGIMRARWGFATSFVHREKHQGSIEMLRQGLDEVMSFNPNFLWALVSTVRHFPLGASQPQYELIGKDARPTLIIWGRQDGVVPFSNCDKMAKIFKNVEVLALDQANHALLHEHPTQIRDKVFTFLN